MANEVAKLLADDVAPVDDVDTAMKLGAGFPKGPAKLADEAGLDTLLETLDDAHEQYGGARYEAAEYLREAANEGGFRGSESDDVSFDVINVTVDEDTAVGTIELDRPERMNSLNLEMIGEIDVAVDQLSEDDDVRAIVLRGAGDRAFCAGADVNEIIVNSDAQEGTAISRTGQETFGKLKECPKPVVAAIDGFTFGGGMELAACADVRIATEGSALGQPEIDLGIIPGWGGTQRLRRIVGEGRAREIILTGDHYDAETMAEYGYLNEVVAEDEFDSFVEDYAADLASGPPIAYEYAKRALLAGQDDVEAGLEIEAQAFGQLVDTEDALEGVSAFNSDEEPDFQGQ
jgi:enoyl-CoA hydratase/3-hydroxyacyl-CoA dehydrogenase